MVDPRLIDWLRASRSILVVTGAGVSTASGIPDFRGPNGVWTRRRPVYYEDFLTSEAARVEYDGFRIDQGEGRNRFVEYAQLHIGFHTAIDGRVDKIVENLGVVKPHFVAAVPRIFEKVYNKVVEGARQKGGATWAIFKWALEVGKEVSALKQKRQEPSGLLAMKYAIRAGIGVGLIPDYLTGEESELVPVLEDTQLPTVPVYFVYPEELKSAKKIQVFRDFMIAKARQWKF